jgi:hypothetical protein
MTSQVNPNNIDGTYPVAGQDNDSQGFRDNFTNIRNNFTYIKAEVEDLQSKAVLKTALTNTTIDNNLQGNAIVGASLTAYRETYNDIGSASGAITVDFTNGNFQKITMSGSTTLAFSFPDSASGQYTSIKLWVVNPNAGYTLTLPSVCTLGDPDSIAGLAGTSPPIITFNSAEIANNTNYLFEFFTVDKGTTIGIRDLIRNRDIDLSGLSITGNLALDNISASGNVVTTNGIFWSGNGLPFSPSGGSGSFTTVAASSTIIGSGNIVAAATTTSTGITTGSFVAKGGVGIAGNLNIGGNVGMDGNTVAIYDSILNLHTYGNLTPWAIDDGKDIGIRMHYYKGADKLSALFMENSNETLVWMQSATETNSNITGTYGNVQFGSLVLSNTTASINSITGALQVRGGVGIVENLNVGGAYANVNALTSTTVSATGNISVGGNLITSAGKINSGTFFANVVTGQNFRANTDYNTYVIDTTSSATIANLWITIPPVNAHGTELAFSLLAPVTSLTVNGTISPASAQVKWVPTTFASTGNVSIKLVYNAPTATWSRSA